MAVAEQHAGNAADRVVSEQSAVRPVLEDFGLLLRDGAAAGDRPHMVRVSVPGRSYWRLLPPPGS